MSSVRQEAQRIVVADDEPGVIELIAAMLTGPNDRPIEIERVLTGEGALAACRKDPPVALLLDIRMPGIDGFETCRLLKQDSRTAAIRVVMVTAFAQDAHMRRSYAAGADGFLTKPFTTAQLVRALRPAA